MVDLIAVTKRHMGYTSYYDVSDLADEIESLRAQLIAANARAEKLAVAVKMISDDGEIERLKESVKELRRDYHGMNMEAHTLRSEISNLPCQTCVYRGSIGCHCANHSTRQP